MIMTYYEICTRHPEYMEEYHTSNLEPTYNDFRNILRNCQDELIACVSRKYSHLTTYIVSNHIEKGESLPSTSHIAEFCLKYEHEVLHNLIQDNPCPIIGSYNENDLITYIKKYPDDNIRCSTLEYCNMDSLIHHLITTGKCTMVNVNNLIGKKNIEQSLLYLILNTTYNVNDMIECIELGEYENPTYMYNLIDTSKFNFNTCKCKEYVLTRPFVKDTDIIRHYFHLNEYDERYLLAIKNKNIGGITIKLRHKFGITLLKKAYEFGITGILMSVHYDDEVVGKGAPCPMHIFLNLMDELPSSLFYVDLVRVKYIDNLIRVLNSYQYHSSNGCKLDNVYHVGIMEYYSRYPNGVIEFIKQVKQDITLALDIINGPRELHHLLDDKYSSLLV